MNPKNRLRSFSLAGSSLIVAALWIVLLGASPAQDADSLYTLQRPGTLYLGTPALPDTVPVRQPDWDYFAWNSFVAVNWPALEEVPDQYRGIPNLSRGPGTSFATAPNDALTVWETFKEKREIFNQLADSGGLTWYSPVDYGPLRLAKGETVKGSTNMRILHQGSGTSLPDGFDETVEVQSQVLEQTLPDGSQNPAAAVIPPVATPRVFRGQPSANNPVVYEVKLNYDYFTYVVGNGLNVDNTDTQNGPVAKKAQQAQIRLPWRTSAILPPSGAGQSSVLRYSANATAAELQAINAVYAYNHKKPRPRTPQTVPPPPGQGSVQVKAAWIKLGGAGAKASDFPTWHTAVAQNYITRSQGGQTVVVPSEPTLFGLVGIHIIQRIHQQTDALANAQPPGGTFIFATWEHDSIFNSPLQGQDSPPPTYFYSNYSAGGGISEPGFFPDLSKPAYPVERRYQILDGTRAVNQVVHEAIRAANGGRDSVWCHYHLVGTQFQAVDLSAPALAKAMKAPHFNENDPTNIGQPVFLANLAIETNQGLQFFKGQPPIIEVIENYSGNPEPTGPKKLVTNNGTPPSFARDNLNTSFNGKGYNMGGCMGCHGVAQTKGYAFSFVLLDGYLGAATDTQNHFDQPGANPK